MWLLESFKLRKWPLFLAFRTFVGCRARREEEVAGAQLCFSGAICLQGLGGASVIVWGSQPGALQLLLPARVTSYLILTDLTQQMFTISQFLWVRNLGAT